LAQQEPSSQELIEEKLQYLRKRREMIRYQEFAEAGYPIGSGCVESANKVVIQARMKQAGMPGCIGLERTLIRWRLCATWPAMTDGRRLGHKSQGNYDKSG